MRDAVTLEPDDDHVAVVGLETEGSGHLHKSVDACIGNTSKHIERRDFRLSQSSKVGVGAKVHGRPNLSVDHAHCYVITVAIVPPLTNATLGSGRQTRKGIRRSEQLTNRPRRRLMTRVKAVQRSGARKITKTPRETVKPKYEWGETGWGRLLWSGISDWRGSTNV